MDTHDLTDPIPRRRPLRAAVALALTLGVGLVVGASAATYALLTQSGAVAAALLELGARLRLASDPLLVYEVAVVDYDTNTAVATHTTARRADGAGPSHSPRETPASSATPVARAAATANTARRGAARPQGAPAAHGPVTGRRT